MSQATKELYEFGGFRLDVSERLLWRAGERVPLSEKAFETLCALVRRGNHLVSKDDLLNEVWADAAVEENNLDKNISLLRQILGERDGKGKFIETVRGHGYRFVAEVRQVGDPQIQPGSKASGEVPAEEPPALAIRSDESSAIPNELFPEIEGRSRGEEGKEGLEPKTGDPFSHTGGQKAIAEKTLINPPPVFLNRDRLVALAVLGLVLISSLSLYLWRKDAQPAAFSTQIKTVAVLPFRPVLAGNRNEALEMGMADTLISKLSGDDGLTVRPLSSVRRFVALEQDSVSAGRELDTEAVLDGSIQSDNGRVRVSVRLIQTSDGKQLWAGQFDEKFTDIFAVQDAISDRVSTALKVPLGSMKKKRSTENVEAYQLYMKGRYHLLKAIKSETEASISCFQQAIELDPHYALAYAGLADAYRGLSVGGDLPPTEFMPKAKAAAERAIEIDDTLAEAHANLGHIMFWYDWDWKAAENQYQRALELDPNSADALQFYAHLLSSSERHEEALAKIKRARELDPLNLRVNAIEGMLLVYAGQPDEAITRLQKTLELDPNYRLANMMAARAYIEKGMLAEAVAATRKTRDVSPTGSEPIAYGAYALAKAGKLMEAQAELDELLKASKTSYVPPYNIALVYNGVGEKEKALDYLEKGYEEKDVRMVFLKVEPKWTNLRSEPRFNDLLKRMRLE